jgi:hypothetical protein
VFNRSLYPAAVAVAAGIGFSGLAATFGVADAPARLRFGPGLELQSRGPKALSRPITRFKKSIDAQERRDRQGDANFPGGVSKATLDAIGQCESGGDPSAVSADGTYRGKYQFDLGTWASVGGHGDPASAPESEQDRRAALLYERTGPSAWPNCG